MNMGAGRIVYQDIDAHRQVDQRRRLLRRTAALVDAIDEAQGERRRAAPVRPDQPGRRALVARARLRGRASWPSGAGSTSVVRGTRSSTGATRRRRAAAGYLREVERQLAKIGVGEHRDGRSGATTRWIATSAGTASSSPTKLLHARRRQAASTIAAAAVEKRLRGARRDRRVRQAARASARRHAGRDPDGDAVIFFNFRADRARAADARAARVDRVRRLSTARRAPEARGVRRA